MGPAQVPVIGGQTAALSFHRRLSCRNPDPFAPCAAVKQQPVFTWAIFIRVLWPWCPQAAAKVEAEVGGSLTWVMAHVTLYCFCWGLLFLLHMCDLTAHRTINIKGYYMDIFFQKGQPLLPGTTTVNIPQPFQINITFQLSKQVEGQHQTSHRCVYMKGRSLADWARSTFVSSVSVVVGYCESSRSQVKPLWSTWNNYRT